MESRHKFMVPSGSATWTAVNHTKLDPHSLLTTNKINLTLNYKQGTFVNSGAIQNSFTTKGTID